MSLLRPLEAGVFCFDFWKQVFLLRCLEAGVCLLRAAKLKGPLTRPVVPLAGLFVKRRFHIHPMDVSLTCVWQTWQRPTLPRLETKYHQRWSVSRPSSEWDRVQPLRHNHQVGKTHVIREAGLGIGQKAIVNRGCLFTIGSLLFTCLFVPERHPQFAFGQSPQARLRVAGRPAPSRSIGP